CLVKMIQVQMAVADGPNEFTGLQVALLSQHVRQQRIGGDIEGYAEEDIGAALVELAGKPALSDIELKQGMARLQSHLLQLADVPGADNDAARVRVTAQHRQRRADLIDLAAVSGSPTAPLPTVDGTEFTVRI